MNGRNWSLNHFANSTTKQTQVLVVMLLCVEIMVLSRPAKSTSYLPQGSTSSLSQKELFAIRAAKVQRRAIYHYSMQAPARSTRGWQLPLPNHVRAFSPSPTSNVTSTSTSTSFSCFTYISRFPPSILQNRYRPPGLVTSGPVNADHMTSPCFASPIQNYCLLPASCLCNRSD